MFYFGENVQFTWVVQVLFLQQHHVLKVSWKKWNGNSQKKLVPGDASVVMAKNVEIRFLLGMNYPGTNELKAAQKDLEPRSKKLRNLILLVINLVSGYWGIWDKSNYQFCKWLSKFIQEQDRLRDEISPLSKNPARFRLFLSSLKKKKTKEELNIFRLSVKKLQETLRKTGKSSNSGIPPSLRIFHLLPLNDVHWRNSHSYRSHKQSTVF